MIFFVVAGAFLSFSSQVRHFMRLSYDRDDFMLKSSVAAIELKEVPNIYEQLRDFNISNDTIIRSLKRERIKAEKKIAHATELNLTHQKSQLHLYKISVHDQMHSYEAYDIDLQ